MIHILKGINTMRSKAKTRIIAAVAALLIACAVLASCGGLEKKLVGKWSGQNTTLGIVTEYSYTFEEDGSGKYTGAAGISAGFTWTLEDDKLTLTSDSAIAGIELFNKTYTVEIKDDKLTLTDSDAVSVTLKRS